MHAQRIPVSKNMTCGRTSCDLPVTTHNYAPCNVLYHILLYAPGDIDDLAARVGWMIDAGVPSVHPMFSNPDALKMVCELRDAATVDRLAGPSGPWPEHRQTELISAVVAYNHRHGREVLNMLVATGRITSCVLANPLVTLVTTACRCGNWGVAALLMDLECDPGFGRVLITTGRQSTSVSERR